MRNKKWSRHAVAGVAYGKAAKVATAGHDGRVDALRYSGTPKGVDLWFRALDRWPLCGERLLSSRSAGLTCQVVVFSLCSKRLEIRAKAAERQDRRRSPQSGKR